MNASSLLNWPEGKGWLVLSGGNSAESIVRASVLTHANPGPVAYLTLSGELNDALLTLEDMESLGAPAGYIVDISREDGETAAALLAEASIVVLEQRLPACEIVRALHGELDELIGEVHENGATLLAEGAGAAAFGRWISEENEFLPALAWLEDVFVTTGNDEPAKVPTFTNLNLHISTESALALGPAGVIQVWGNQDVRITLGSDHFS